MGRVIAFIFTLLGTVVLLGAQEDATPPLVISPEDIRIEQSLEGGYYLYIRKLPGMESVMLTESAENPDGRGDTYAFRNPEYHPKNGDEKRMLDGEFLDLEDTWFLIDSTAEPDEEFAEAFVIFIPYIVDFGYDWTRNGEIMVLDGAYLSIRAFSKAYGDYSGEYRDNPFILRVTQAPKLPPPPEPVPEGPYMEDTVDEFSEIADEGDGERRFSTGPEDTVAQLRSLLPEPEGQSLDLVIALDTTKSMEDDVPFLRRDLVPMVEEVIEGFSEVRIGFMLYRDYMEEYLVRKMDFQEELSSVQNVIDRIRVAGGRDIPEAVYEALWASIEGFDWAADEKIIVLVGDAPPHPRPRGRVTADQVFQAAADRGIIIHTIILPP